MFVLNLDVSIKPGMDGRLLETYRGVFVPAISRQPGFVETKLMVSRTADSHTHRLTIVFEKEDKQQQWVGTDLHQQVWPQMEDSMADYVVRKYETL